MKSTANEKSAIRLLNILVRYGKSGVVWKQCNDNVVLEIRQGSRVFHSSIINRAESSGLINNPGQRLVITKAGKSKLRRHLCDHDPFAGQHRWLQQCSIKLHDQTHQVIENCAESPLARLYSRKQKDGSRFISIQEYEAGGRLRRDFEKARLQPSISARWQEGVSTGNKTRPGNNACDLSDLAIDARKRLEKAINAIGPELTGVTLDICCFLKGFEIVERERNWPSRSAKLMLKTALSNLARHYGLTTPIRFNTGENNSHIGQWGTADYKPAMTPV